MQPKCHTSIHTELPQWAYCTVSKETWHSLCLRISPNRNSIINALVSCCVGLCCWLHWAEHTSLRNSWQQSLTGKAVLFLNWGIVFHISFLTYSFPILPSFFISKLSKCPQSDRKDYIESINVTPSSPPVALNNFST